LLPVGLPAAEGKECAGCPGMCRSRKLGAKCGRGKDRNMRVIGFI